MKRCWDCKHDKTLDQFGKDRSRKDGKNPRCKACHNAWMSQYQKAHPMYVKQKNVNRKRQER